MKSQDNRWLAVGALFLGVGLLLLVANFDVLHITFHFGALFGNFWPLILILLGLWLAMANKQLVAAIAIGTVLAAIWSVSYAPQGLKDYLNGDQKIATQSFDEPLGGGATQLKLSVDQSASVVVVHGQQSTQAYAAQFAGAPRIQEKAVRTGNRLDVDLARDTGGRFWHSNDVSGQAEIGLSSIVPVQFELHSAGQQKLDLSDVLLAKLDLKIEDGTSDVTFGQKVPTQADLEAKNATLTLRVPKAVNLTIALDNDTELSANNFEQAGLIRSDTSFTSADAAADAPTLAVHLEAKASTIRLIRM